MSRIFIASPGRPGSRSGNLHTAQRWARLLRAEGHEVEAGLQWTGERCDTLIALHARRSHPSVLAWRKARPRGGLVVTLTGTDLYKDLPDSSEARRSLELADRIIVLQDDAPRRLAPSLRSKTDVVFQSSSATLQHSPPKSAFRVAVVGHLREEKDPFRAVLALPWLRDLPVDVLQLGAAMSPDMAAAARRWMKAEPRYRWLGSVPHARALSWIARSHALVVSSRMEGGANVICEAARIGTPVLASRMSGNLGMLGKSYPGYYPLADEQALARLIRRAATDAGWLRGLRRALAARRGLFAPAAEQRALAAVLRRLVTQSRAR